MTAFFAPIPTGEEVADLARRRWWHRFLLATALVWGLIGLSQTSVSDARIAGASPASARAHVVYCHSAPDALAWCEWVEFMQDPANAAWFAWVTAPPATLPIPPVLHRIARCEGYPHFVHRDHGHTTSTAAGKYGFLDGTWRAWRGAEGARYARAHHAPEWVQDNAAVRLWRAHGTTPWNASRGCWA